MSANPPISRPPVCSVCRDTGVVGIPGAPCSFCKLARIGPAMSNKPALAPCGDCGMPCEPGEYHPFAACLMFKACHNSETVRANLAAVRAPAVDAPAPAPPVEASDTERVNFLERWVANAKARGFVWDTFDFDTKRPVREQLDEQMAAGLVELSKHTAAPKADAPDL